MSRPFRLSRHDVRWCFLFMHDIELLLSAVRSLTFRTLQLQIWYDGALTGQMCNLPVLPSSEGQKNETPGSIVSHCWPWLQVIKALLSFCQISDSPNISPWLISAVFSVRVYTKLWKDQHPVSVLHFNIHLSIPSSKKPTQMYFDIILFARRKHIILSYIAVLCECRAKRTCVLHWLKIENLEWSLMGILWFCQVVLQLKSSSFLLSWINSPSTESQPSDITKLSFVKFLLLRCAPWMRMGIRRCDRRGLGQRQVCRCHAAG